MYGIDTLYEVNISYLTTAYYQLGSVFVFDSSCCLADNRKARVATFRPWRPHSYAIAAVWVSYYYY